MRQRQAGVGMCIGMCIVIVGGANAGLRAHAATRGAPRPHATHFLLSRSISRVFFSISSLRRLISSSYFSMANACGHTTRK